MTQPPQARIIIDIAWFDANTERRCIPPTITPQIPGPPSHWPVPMRQRVQTGQSLSFALAAAAVVEAEAEAAVVEAAAAVVEAAAEEAEEAGAAEAEAEAAEAEADGPIVGSNAPFASWALRRADCRPIPSNMSGADLDISA
jgi:hypothetical protein